MGRHGHLRGVPTTEPDQQEGATGKIGERQSKPVVRKTRSYVTLHQVMARLPECGDLGKVESKVRHS